MDSYIPLNNAFLMIINKDQINDHVFVNTFARLHMGFLDLNGSQGRRFGSLGLGLNAPDTMIELAAGSNVFGGDEEASYVSKSKQLILQYAKVERDVSIKVHREIPRHFGLGSGTQMALAIGAGINQLFGLNLKPMDVAEITGRGLRSGIGVGTFASGGLVLDGGRGAETKVPPIIAQHAFPEAWRVLLIFDHNHIGVHGDEEVKAFATLKAADIQKTQEINHQVLMKALPAIQEHDLKAFGDAVAALQAYTGDYFSPVQGGRYASKLVTQVLNYLTRNDALCVGQSSWGPTGFAIFESHELAERYLKKLKSAFQDPKLSWLLCEANNVGASVNVGNKPLISA
jgi:beta-ribofuranosylaminobenzene 5'-phosphate synthase